MRLLPALLALLLAALPARAEELIATPHGAYAIRMPEGTGPFPAVMHLHGWGASAAAVFSDTGTTGAILARGYAIIAPQGLAPEGYSERDWGVADGWDDPRDDAAFLAEVLADAAARGWIDRERVLLSGFSRGGSMVWDIACHHPALAAAYAPVAGAFWEPLPEGCAAPVDLFHTHGWTDGVVPLEGRSVAAGQLTQGDTFAALALLRAASGAPRANEPAFPVTRDAPATGAPWRRVWPAPSGAEIVLELHTGGHMVPPGWADRALDWFEARRAAHAACTLAGSGTPASC